MSSSTWRLAAVTALAALVVTGAIIASSSSGSGTAKPTVKAATSALDGIPENNGVLGDPKAPITVTEFVDPQCPVCAAAARETLPSLIDNYVRTGNVKLRARILHFLGPDSATAAQYAAGAREQGRLWPFLETFYASQGTENSGYVTPSFLAGVAKAAGVDDAKAAAFAATPAAGEQLNTANREAKRLGVTGTPTFVVTRADGSERVVGADQLATELNR